MNKSDYSKLYSYDAKAGLYYSYYYDSDGKRKRMKAKDPAVLHSRLELARSEGYRPRTWADAASAWQESKWPSIRAGTQQCYAPALKRSIEELGPRLLSELIPAEFSRIIERMKAQGFSSKSVKTQKTVMNQICQYAITHDPPWLTVNPMSAVTVPRGLPRKKRSAPEEDVIRRVIASADTAYFGLFPLLIVSTGLRRGEALALRWQDISDGIIHVRWNCTFPNGMPELGPTKTEAGSRDIPLLPALSSRLIPPAGALPDHFVFPSPTDPTKPMNENCFKRHWLHWCSDMNLTDVRLEDRVSSTGRHYAIEHKTPAITPHQLRHAFASICLDAGLEAKDTQVLMGHTDISLTLQIYTDILASRQQASTAKLADYMAKLSPSL